MCGILVYPIGPLPRLFNVWIGQYGGAGFGDRGNCRLLRMAEAPYCFLGEVSVPRAQSFPARARFTFWGGRANEVHFAADVPMGVAGGRVRFTTSLRGADICSPLRKSALESLGG